MKQRRKAEFALIRKFEGEPFFGVQLAGTNPEEIGWAAALVESRGADLVDLNCGCPIDHFTHKGIGAALGRQPQRIRRIAEAMKKAVTKIPVTVKLRLGWNDEMRNVIEQAQAAVDGGADALFVHGRTRNARYRFAADWEAIGSVVAAVPVPVVGNGDILFPQDVTSARARSGAAGVMSARGVLIKPWLFREVSEGYRDLTADERVAIYRRYVTLAREHWGADAHGLERVRQFTRWHIDFWHRYVPRRIRRHVIRAPGPRGRASPRHAARCLSRANGRSRTRVPRGLPAFEREIDLNDGSPASRRRRTGVCRSRGLTPPRSSCNVGGAD